MWLAMNKLNYALHTQTLRVAIGLEGPYLLEHLLYALYFYGGNCGKLSSWCSCGAPEAQLMLGRHLDFDQLRAIAGVVSSLFSAALYFWGELRFV